MVESIKIIVRGFSGALHHLTYGIDTTVEEVKKDVGKAEGVQWELLVLLHAGRELRDQDSLELYSLDKFSLADEVFLYLNRRFAEPAPIFLAPKASLSNRTLIRESVELDSAVAGILPLLEAHELTAPGTHRDTAAIIVKRDNQTTVQASVKWGDTIRQVSAKVEAVEGVRPQHLVFIPAADGNLHIVVSPAACQASDTFPVYKRIVQPQLSMLVKNRVDMDSMQPLPALVKELCVMP